MKRLNVISVAKKEILLMVQDPINQKTGIVKIPTMYDLPSELPEGDTLPDQLHVFLPQLLMETFKPTTYPAEQIFCIRNMHLYFDLQHPKWSIRPDWFGVVGVPRFYGGYDMRYSYVVWDEKVSPLVVVELLTECTKKDDLGKSKKGSKPTKWQVYEEILQVPYYITFDCAINRLKAFRWQPGGYVPFEPTENGLWIKEAGLCLEVWFGSYDGIERSWLRWKKEDIGWIPTREEKLVQERKEKEAALQLAQQLIQQNRLMAAKLRELGVDPNEIINKK